MEGWVWSRTAKRRWRVENTSMVGCRASGALSCIECVLRLCLRLLCFSASSCPLLGQAWLRASRKRGWTWLPLSKPLPKLPPPKPFLELPPPKGLAGAGRERGGRWLPLSKPLPKLPLPKLLLGLPPPKGLARAGRKHGGGWLPLSRPLPKVPLPEPLLELLPPKGLARDGCERGGVSTLFLPSSRGPPVDCSKAPP